VNDSRDPFGNAWRLFRDLWRLIRGEDQRGRKVRWLIGLLRPYRARVALTAVALVIATAAALAPPTSPASPWTRGSPPRTRARF
jgi:hypothetical protein